MSDQPRLFTREEWEAMTDQQREQIHAQRRRAVEAMQRERQALNDALTVERFRRHDT